MYSLLSNMPLIDSRINRAQCLVQNKLAKLISLERPQPLLNRLQAVAECS